MRIPTGGLFPQDREDVERNVPLAAPAIGNDVRDAADDIPFLDEGLVGGAGEDISHLPTLLHESHLNSVPGVDDLGDEGLRVLIVSNCDEDEVGDAELFDAYGLHALDPLGR